MNSGPLKGVGHVIEVKTIEKPSSGLDYWLPTRVAVNKWPLNGGLTVVLKNLSEEY